MSGPTADDAVIEVRAATKRYRGRRGEVEAVAPTSLAVRQGSFISLVGPSGCGKSTLLRLILGLEQPTEGEVLVEGRRVERPSPRVGMMLQTPALVPWRTVKANVLLPVDYLGRRSAGHVERASQLIDLVGLTRVADAYPSELSGGMQQRAALCRSLIFDPPTLVLDEPFGALDHITREQLNDELLRIWGDSGKTVVLVTHAIDEAVYLSDEVFVMTAHPGRIADRLTIDLPRPRSNETRALPAFEGYAVQIRKLLGLGSLTGG